MEEKGLIPQEVTSAISPTASPNILINQGEGLQIMENHGAININANDQTLTKLLASRSPIHWNGHPFAGHTTAFLYLKTKNSKTACFLSQKIALC